MVGESAQGKVKSNFKRSSFPIHEVIAFQPILTGAGKLEHLQKTGYKIQIHSSNSSEVEKGDLVAPLKKILPTLLPLLCLLIRGLPELQRKGKRCSGLSQSLCKASRKQHLAQQGSNLLTSRVQWDPCSNHQPSVWSRQCNEASQLQQQSRSFSSHKHKIKNSKQNSAMWQGTRAPVSGP